MTMQKSVKDLCPCNSGSSYSACCQPLHTGTVAASSAEQLMRSRYSAFCLKNAPYLIATLHPDYRSADDQQSLAELFEQTQWLGLKVISHKSKNNTATVEFSAFYQDANQVAQLHERSRFVKIENRWFYQDGDLLPPITLARNDSCFCGSGIKYKKCHGR
ncbi:MAG: YchJ family protein [Gammaproteobacteria bacterium]|nr:YchJ family protein [Gammaproteobacteria bacterium]